MEPGYGMLCFSSRLFLPPCKSEGGRIELYCIFELSNPKAFMGTEELSELIFVYNADSGIKNALLDGAHKVLSPATYECKLCQLTHGAILEKKVWRNFREQHELPMKFLHKDEFRKEYSSKFGHRFDFPLVLGATHSGLEVVVNKEELSTLSDTEAFIAMLKARI